MCLIRQEDFIYILIPVNLQLVVHYINTEWEAQTDCIHEQKTLRSSKELLYNRTRVMWFSHKCCKFFTFAQKSRL